jgi:hypothetical protein
VGLFYVQEHVHKSVPCILAAKAPPTLRLATSDAHCCLRHASRTRGSGRSCAGVPCGPSWPVPA